MNRTLFMLLAQYDGKPMIPAETACKDFFAPCTYPTFLRKLEAGDIPLPLVKMERSQKGARMIHLSDLAAYIDLRRDDAAREMKKLRA